MTCGDEFISEAKCLLANSREFLDQYHGGTQTSGVNIVGDGSAFSRLGGKFGLLVGR